MKPEHLKTHKRLVRLCRSYTKHEAPIVAELQLAIKDEIFRHFKKTPYRYAVEICGLTEGNAYSFIAVAKKASLHPCLHEAIAAGKLTVNKAYRIVSIIETGNADELVEFAKTHTQNEIERDVRRRNPKAAAPRGSSH